MKLDLYNGDCLDIMDRLIADGVVVDAIITDPPYGTTACKWDNVIPFDKMWLRLNKLIKPNGAIVLFGSEPFSSALRMSNIKNYKYDWYWEKSNSVGFLNAKKMPLKNVENISVFSNTQALYNPQGLEEINKTLKNDNSKNGKNNSGISSHNGGRLKTETFVRTHTNYPTQKLLFKSERGLHPTQKPTALMEYLIKTYTNENETVLDFTMGSGTTGVACKNLNRNFIGIEQDERYFKIAEDRINKPKDTLF